MIGNCFGFEIRSEMPWRFLREGSGDALEVIQMSQLSPDPAERLILRWTPTIRNPVRATLFALPESRIYRLTIDDADSFLIDLDNRQIGVVPSLDLVRTEERLWGLPAMLAFLDRGDLPLHGASVEVQGRALLLCGPSRHGKTSLAAAFHRSGHRLLAEDLSCLRVDDSISVLPGPASLRVRHDMVEPLSLQDVEMLAEDEDRVHFSISSHRRGSVEPVRVAGVVLLKDESTEICLERADPAKAIQDLWFLSFNLPSAQDRARCFLGLADLSRQTPVWNLARPMRVDDLDETVERLVRILDG